MDLKDNRGWGLLENREREVAVCSREGGNGLLDSWEGGLGSREIQAAGDLKEEGVWERERERMRVRELNLFGREWERGVILGVHGFLGVGLIIVGAGSGEMRCSLLRLIWCNCLIDQSSKRERRGSGGCKVLNCPSSRSRSEWGIGDLIKFI